MTLARLAQVDDEAAILTRELREIPAQLQALQADVQKLESLLEQEKRQVADAEKMLASQVQELAQKQDDLTRSRIKGTKARNTREADASERELEALRRLLKEREEEGGKLRQALATMQAAVDKHQGELDELRGFCVEDAAQAESRLDELRQQYATVEQGRNRLVAALPREILTPYERVRERRGSGVAWMHNSTCSSCRVSLPHQMVVAVQRGEELAQCPNCLRVLLDGACQSELQNAASV